MSYEEIENKFGTEEGISTDDAKVREMLSGMKRVEAPKNFAFGVQARIANAKPEDFRANSWLPVLRYAAPLALVLVVTAAFVINGLYSVNETSVPVVAEGQEAQPPMDPSPVTPGSEVAVRVPDPIGGSTANSNTDTNDLASNPRRSPLERRTRDPRDAGAGSITSGQGSRSPVIDLDPRVNPLPGANRTGFESRGEINIRRVLEIVGIDADSSDQGWKVKSVVTNSVSERSGVKAGDLIEAINGLPVTDGTRFSGSFNGKNLRVKRDGKTVQIDLNVN